MSGENELSKDEIRRLDAVVEHEIAQGHRVRKVPESVDRALKEEGINAPAFVRFNRVNPARRRYISEEVQQRYHKDLRNNDLMSNAQILKVVAERGEWDGTMQQRMEDLQRSTTQDMAKLWEDGLTPDTEAFSTQIMNLVGRQRMLIDSMDKPAEVKAELLTLFDRWLGYGPDSVDDPAYDDFSPIDAQARMYDELPVEGAQIVLDLEDVKDKQVRLVRLAEQRVELLNLQLRHAKIFSNTAESRRDHSEEMAQLYFTCERCNEAGKSEGSLTPKFDDLWNYPDVAVKWLLYESYFFHQNVPDGAREYLETFGFLGAERDTNTASNPSAGSPAPQSFSPVGTPAEATPAESGASSPDRTLTTAS